MFSKKITTVIFFIVIFFLSYMTYCTIYFVPKLNEKDFSGIDGKIVTLDISNNSAIRSNYNNVVTTPYIMYNPKETYSYDFENNKTTCKLYFSFDGSSLNYAKKLYKKDNLNENITKKSSIISYTRLNTDIYKSQTDIIFKSKEELDNYYTKYTKILYNLYIKENGIIKKYIPEVKIEDEN